MALLILALSSSGAVLPLVIAGGILALVVIAVATRILLTVRKLRREAQPGLTASVVAQGQTPLTTFNRAGKPGDPINVQVLATSGQIGAAFAAAGWYRADEIDLITSVRISVDSVLGRRYSTAPVSNLYLYGRKEDLAFERPGSSVRERDHIRFWNTGDTGSNTRPIWVGSGTRDVKVELSKTSHLPTHGISPEIDMERDQVVSALARTGYVVAETIRPGFGKETHGVNGGGDPYTTDGQVAVLTLADVWTLPFATQVRSPFGARIRQQLEWLFRGRLPKVGRDRAASERDRVKQRSTGASKAAV